jgi:hypothetical protein
MSASKSFTGLRAKLVEMTTEDLSLMSIHSELATKGQELG